MNSASQVTRDVEALYGALQTACKRGVAKNILMKHEKTSNGVAVWQDLIEEFGNDGDKESRIANLEDVVNTPYTKAYRGGLRGWIMDYQNAFAELELLGEMSYADEESKKRKILQNCVSSDSKDAMILKEICANKYYKDTCKMICVHAIAVDERGPEGGCILPLAIIRHRLLINVSKIFLYQNAGWLDAR